MLRFSALIGGAFAAWLVDNNTHLISSAAAQSQPFTAAPVAAPVTNAAIAPNPALTPQELTNIRVYDGANRGVVNILTRIVSYDRFFMLPTPGEGRRLRIGDR